MSSVIRFNLFGKRWFLRAPWQAPLFSERNRLSHYVLIKAFGWRVTVRTLKHGQTL